MPKTLQELLAALPFAYRWVGPETTVIEITGVTDDNRQVRPGNAFVAYPGVAVDGHRFIADAVQRGASAIVCEIPLPDLPVPQVVVASGRQSFAFLCAAWHDFPSRTMVMIGVTGTDGKTTTTNLVFNILKAAGMHVGMISTVNAVIGERVLDTGLHTTTPDADEIQGYLAQMRDAGMTHCVLEVTSHALAQYRVDGVDFDVATVTNITHEHLDLHGSYEAYRAAKARLFEMLTQSGVRSPAQDDLRRVKPPMTRTAVLNADDAFSFDFLRMIPARRQIAYTQCADPLPSGPAVVRLIERRDAPEGMHLRVHTPRGDLDLTSVLMGDFNVSNILAAVSVAIALDIPADAIQAGLAVFRGVPGRMERIDMGQSFTAIVDFAHTPNALEQFLRAARQITPGQLIVVFGCAGERDVQKRPMMGHVAASYADQVILTAEDPRRENLSDILDQIQTGIRDSKATVHRVPDRNEAIQFACSLAQPGDTVVSCGKGHEQSMCFGTTETPWDDRRAMRTAIEKRMGVRG